MSLIKAKALSLAAHAAYAGAAAGLTYLVHELDLSQGQQEAAFAAAAFLAFKLLGLHQPEPPPARS